MEHWRLHVNEGQRKVSSDRVTFNQTGCMVAWENALSALTGGKGWRTDAGDSPHRATQSKALAMVVRELER